MSLSVKKKQQHKRLVKIDYEKIFTTPSAKVTDNKKSLARPLVQSDTNRVATSS